MTEPNQQQQPTMATNSNTPPVIIPWSCLSQSSKPPLPPSPPTQQKTFAQALSNVCDIPLSQLPKPCVKGDRIAITIPEDEYLAGVEACKHNLHGRIIWPKGSPPLTVETLKTKLSMLWKSIGKWGVISLGKGFFEFSFSTLEDMRSVRSVGSWHLSPGLLKLFAWSKDFNPSMQQQSSAQVWIRIYGLSQEYWRPKILFAIASSVGIPICTDSFTNKPMLDRSFGHFVRVFVDVNMTQDLRYRVLVERTGFAFFVDVEYENLPDFCDHCNIIGHKFDNCKKRKESAPKDNPVKKNTAPAKHFVPVLNKEKPIEVVNLEGVTPNNYSQVRHVEERLAADTLLENEINKAAEADALIVVNTQSEHEIPEKDSPQKVASKVVPGSSDTDSDYVESTQFIEEGIENIVVNEQVPLLVQNDIAFLKESWANLAELEDQTVLSPVIPVIAESTKPSDYLVDVNQLAERASPSNVDNEGFKLVTPRSSKKSKPPQKSSYSTRSRVGTSKPSR
jgi:hypothetical protein